MYADGAGYFAAIDKQFHTQIKVLPLASPTAASAAFYGGNAQILTGTVSHVTADVVQGRDIQSMFLNYTGLSVVMIGAEKYRQDRGSNFAAYKDSSWCYTTPGAATWVTAEAEATAAGLDWPKMNGIAVGSTSAYLPTMKAGRCDITAMDTGSAATAIAQGIGYLMDNPTEPAVQKKLFGGIQLGLTVATSHSFMKNYPALTQAIITAFAKAQVQMQRDANDPAAIYSKLPSYFTSQNSLQSYKEQWALTSPEYSSTSGIVTDDEIEATFKQEVQNGLLPKNADLNTVKTGFSNQYALQAYKDLGLPTPPSSGLLVANS
jgi:ABC-type nitrate/sulfonate/bicarbonate transport system substrate-binding protein